MAQAVGNGYAPSQARGAIQPETAEDDDERIAMAVDNNQALSVEAVAQATRVRLSTHSPPILPGSHHNRRPASPT